jgi:FSR family fosmidomycin resistance protein-like MFS transporter
MSVFKLPQWNISPALRRAAGFTLLLLAIEFLDELVFGAEEAAWPLIRDDLHLTYWQIGLLLGLPNFLANFVELFVGILGDVWKRRVLVVGGGIFFTLALLLIGVAPSFPVLLLAFVLFAPASGAFVSLSQASLMDSDPQRHEHLMARWTLAGSLGVVAGPLALGAALWLGLGWRGLFLIFTVLALALVVLAWPQRFPNGHGEEASDLRAGLRTGWRNALMALRRREVWRWLILLEFSDFMLDILLGFLALYVVDVAGGSPEQGALAVAVWSGFGLLGDALFIPLLEKVRGLNYLRFSAWVMFGLYVVFLLLPTFWAKLIVLALMGLFNAGWYAILQGRLYSAMPGQSGTVMAVGSIFGLGAALVPTLLGVVAESYGLNVTMWLLLLGPIALLVGLPRVSAK